MKKSECDLTSDCPQGRRGTEYLCTSLEIGQALVYSQRTSYGPKKLSRDLFDISVYNSDGSTNRFHGMTTGLSAHVVHAKPTKFHHFLDGLACSGRLLRQYTQNIDCLESKLPSLSPNASLEAKGPWAKTIQLHGRLGPFCPGSHTSNLSI